MSKDLDDITLAVAKAVAVEPVFKGLEPAARYRLYKWLNQPGTLSPEQKVKVFIKKMEETMSAKTLSKNESQFTFFDNGAVRMDFGKDVPEKVKKAALDWAKRRGLNAVEIPLNKSVDAPYTIIFGSRTDGATVIDKVRKSY